MIQYKPVIIAGNSLQEKVYKDIARVVTSEKPVVFDLFKYWSNYKILNVV